MHNVSIFSYTRVRNDKSDDDSSIASSGHELHMSRNSSPHHSLESNLSEKPNVDIIGRMMDPVAGNSHHRRQFSTGSFIISEANDTVAKGERYLSLSLSHYCLIYT